ncbi:TlpA family protein disulfide reductase [Achromobacter arsenitoxydans]|uniref:Alkyl hydroperoxide reductase n=1 Tax=Achromobacter arsenitoxydans SY8 TaxID=477184 RepID=H0F4F9_9BURK|nr:TlpA disulfide reductase family protein [Achromobacter arsenitoxydans]EHK66776.1 alkyl hydroperoxide reductase [Achromobacter arsenitoxydans SY8]
MPPAIRLGPLVFPSELAVLVAAAALGLLAARFLDRRPRPDRRPDVSGVLWGALIAGLVAARLAFVWEYRDHYAQNPLGTLDLRDGGWSGIPGLAAAWIYGAAALLRRAAPRPAVLGALALATLAWLVGGRLLAPADQPAPALAELQLQALDGAPSALSAFQGKPAVINLWASWCPPCRREMPAFARAQAANPDVHFVFLNQGEASPDIARYLQEHAPGLQNVLRDPGSDASRKLSNSGLPATLFLDAEGRLVELRVGELSAATLAQRVKAIRSEAGSR